MAPSSSSCKWVYDVFPSFSGEDVRVTFLSHFLKELDRKLIIAFRDSKIQRSQSLDPVLKQAIKDSRIAVVIFSKNYASSSWCLNELLEIVKCKEDCGQMVIPVFYGLDPSHVRKQTGDFGKIFAVTCRNNTEQVKNQWRRALTDVANILGFHSVNWGNEAKMIEKIANDVLSKLHLTTSKDSEDFVGIKDHIAKMSALLQLESEEVMMVGIWGSSGIGKTTIARVLFNRLSRYFQGRIFIDRSFISKSMDIYSKGNPDDYNMKLHLQEKFLCEILGKRHIKIDYLGAVGERLKNQKVLIVIDDLDDQVVLDALAGQTHWFGGGSRIVVITKDKQFLRAHGIDLIYEVGLPTKDRALQMLCRCTFKKNSPPDDLMELASEVALLAGNLPLGLNVLGSYLRGRDKEDWMDMMPRLRNGLDGKIEKTLRLTYDGLDNRKDKTIFRHIACLFNGQTINDIKLLLADSSLDVSIGLKNLVDKSLVHLRGNTIEMHRLLQEMGKEIVRTQSNEQGEREFLMDSKDICYVLDNNTGTKKVLGIALDINEIDELHIHENSFKEMDNLLYLEIYPKSWERKKGTWHLSEGFFDYLPPKLRLLRLDGYPMRCMPSNFCPENLVKLVMRNSSLEKLWDGVHSLTGLKDMDLCGSENLKEIPDLSMATNLETLYLHNCSNLVELPSSIQYLNKLERLYMGNCTSLETIPTGMNLQSLFLLNLNSCSRLRTFPQISTNITWLDLIDTSFEEFPSNLRIENLEDLFLSVTKSGNLWERVQPLPPLMTMLSPSLTMLYLSNIQSLVELPSSFQNLNKLWNLKISDCVNLETFPTGINLESLQNLDLTGCLRLRTIPHISTHISRLVLSKTAIEEVPWWIENSSNLKILFMKECNNLQCVSLNISKLKRLQLVNCSDCKMLTTASWNDNSQRASPFPCEVSSFFPEVRFNFSDCFHLDQEALLHQQLGSFKSMIFSGEEVPSYFTHRTTGTSLTNIPLLQTSHSQQFIRFRACVVVDTEYLSPIYVDDSLDNCFVIQVSPRFVDKLGNHYDSFYWSVRFFNNKLGCHLVIFDCGFTLGHQAENCYDHVDIQFRFKVHYSHLKLKGCGIRILEDSPSGDKQQPCNRNILPHIRESDKSNDETEHSSVGRRVMMLGILLLKKLMSCFAFEPRDTWEDVNDNTSDLPALL